MISRKNLTLFWHESPVSSDRFLFDTLRLSMTAACNYACHYCVPAGAPLRRMPGELEGEVLADCVRLLGKVGIRRLRLTGGEPLISPALPAFLEQLPRLGLERIGITTNGAGLEQWAERLARSGVTVVNVSLDSLDTERFAQMTRGGRLDQVIRGLSAAVVQGLHIKLNMVPMRSKNLADVVPLVDFSIRHGYSPRFIEFMQMGHWHGSPNWRSELVTSDEILKLLGNHGYSIRPLGRQKGRTAQQYALEKDGQETQLGIVANESHPFCSDCRRLRLTADGQLYGCIGSKSGQSMLHLLAGEGDCAELEKLLGSLFMDKPKRFSGGWMSMRVIGG